MTAAIDCLNGARCGPRGPQIHTTPSFSGSLATGVNMYVSSFSKYISVLICFLMIAVGMRAQSAPTFTFGPPAADTSQPGKFLAVDINNDGFVDVVSIEANPSGASVMIYFHNGDG